MGKKVYVAGGGAAGMCAAVYAARNGADVTIIEKNTRLGKKLSVTGNGRCNLTNLDMRPEYYNKAAEGRMKTWLSLYGPEETIRFFKSIGVIVKSEDGYIYPVSGQASTVVSALENEIKRLKVKVITESQVKAVKRDESDGSSYLLITNKDKYRADSVILALGSLSGAKSTMSTGDGYYICKQLGMGFKDTYPALVGFKCEAGDVMPDAGVRAGARISFFLGDELITSESGELQISKDGISGIPVMQASREVIKFVTEKNPIVASADFFPDYDDADFEALKSDMLKLRDDRTLEEFLLGFANSNINDMVLKKMKLSPSMHMKNIAESMASCILDRYRDIRFNITDSYGYLQSQVTTGGMSLGDIGDDMSVAGNPGIFCAGELLDVDGRCGGYNLQFAWTSGSIAGTAASSMAD